MKLVVLSGSNVGTKTRTAMDYTLGIVREKYPDADVALLDLAEYEIVFSDGRDYREYEGDTKFVTETIMNADAVLIGTPTFQASIPATLKNMFDLLPVNAFRDKVVGMLVTAGTAKHYLMAEQQLKPILAYMKAHVVPAYVFVEEKDFNRKAIVNDDVLFRMERLVEDTFAYAEAFAAIRKAKDAAYDF
ncbi:NADPH-dependent FMN reductase [Paenibacillus glycinis]|uniref:FMN reductase n=1 Tax=Paenibacillus glycinis TaxID=2697035 RepID=A0ABW9XR92_9BACL|nr:NADPH-dependent FMN reductase [Paenibacillus glycinis]NBD25168.1 FMN reductase [Paenibacillus glycinis]